MEEEEVFRLFFGCYGYPGSSGAAWTAAACWWEGHHGNGGFTHGDTVNSIAAGTAPPQWSGSAPSYARARHGHWGLMTGRVDYINDIQAPAHPDPTESLESRYAVRDGWKFMLFTNGNKELYHLYDGSTPVNPHETNNLAASNPQLFSELTMAIVNWYAPDPNDYNSWIGDPALAVAPAKRALSLDPDGDLLPNGIEAWFGTHPGMFSQGITEVATIGNVTTFRHPHNPNLPSDLVGTYEWSPNLIDWYAGNGVDGPPGGPTLTIVPQTAGTTTTVSATASEAMERIFLRAVVIEN